MGDRVHPVRLDSWYECAAVCGADPTCWVWTYHNNASWAYTGVCNLMSSITGFTNHNLITSGDRDQSNTFADR